jgi:hypothetical protein
MLTGLNAEGLKSNPKKIFPCNFDEVCLCVQSKYRTSGLATLRCFQKGCQ